MCGIAGYSLDADSGVDRTLAAQALLAGIAERGADAVGYAHRGSGPDVSIHKRRSGATALLEDVLLPTTTTDALVHVRDYTKGHPTILANNHPIRHGSVVGIHNGIIANDEEIFDRYDLRRAEPEMTVDSEAIFALVNTRRSATGCSKSFAERWRPRGWTSAHRRFSISLAASAVLSGSAGRRRELFFASTKAALEVVEHALRLTLRKQEVSEGRLVASGTRSSPVRITIQGRSQLSRDARAPRRASAPRRRRLPRQARLAHRLKPVRASRRLGP